MMYQLNNTTKLWQSAMNRDEKGKFSPSILGEKKIRSMKLTDECWKGLESKANDLEISRSELIERFARDAQSEQEIILKALKSFIVKKESEFGKNPSQKGKEFNSNTRNWQALNEFMQLIEVSPWELLENE